MRTEAQRRYATTEKARAYAREYQRKVRATPEGRAYMIAYRASPAGRASALRNKNSLAKRAATERYRASGKGAERMRARHLEKTFGLTVDGYAEILRGQGGVCAICARMNPDGRRLHVDHDHNTGKIRALLCFRCNSMLGMALDSSATLLLAAAYIKKHNTEDARALLHTRP